MKYKKRGRPLGVKNKINNFFPDLEMLNSFAGTTPITTEEFELNERQLKIADLHRKAYGKIVILKQKNKFKLLNPGDVTVITG